MSRASQFQRKIKNHSTSEKFEQGKDIKTKEDLVLAAEEIEGRLFALSTAARRLKVKLPGNSIGKMIDLIDKAVNNLS